MCTIRILPRVPLMIGMSIAVSLVLATAQGPTIPADVVIALDNSGSMKQNDPRFLMPEVVSAFATRLAPDARLGIILFARDVEVVLGLMAVDAPDFAQQVSASLKRIDYRGQRTDIPAAVERAIYELRTHGRPEAQRLIVFLTDGLVDIGSPVQNLERARWLREDLALEAKQLGIRLFGVALTEAADFQLVQSVAQKTGGAYFRVVTAADIPGTFARINTQLEEMARAAVQVPREAMPERDLVPDPVPTVPSGPVVVQVPVRDADWRPWLFGGLGLVVCGIVAVLALRSARRSTPKVVVPAATLYDRGGNSAAQEYAIGKPMTRIGRDTKTNAMVIAHDTVSSQHAVIEYRDGAFHLRDLRSTNGTFVNGKKVSDSETIREVVLKHRDRIRFDAYEFEFVLDALADVQQTRLADAESAGRTRLRAHPPEAPVHAQAAAAPQPAAGEPVAPAGEADEPQTRLKPMCPRHQAWQATELCEKCHTAFCKQCIKDHDGQALCIGCLEQAP